MNNSNSDDIFNYRPRILYLAPLLLFVNVMQYVSGTCQKSGIAPTTELDITAASSSGINLFSLGLFIASAALLYWLYRLHFKNTRYIKLTDDGIFAPKHSLSAKFVDIKYVDIISIRKTELSGSLQILHKNGKLTLQSNGFRDKQIKNNIFNDIQKRVKASHIISE